MFEYFADLGVAASSAAEPASRAAAATSANGQMTVTFQVSGFPDRPAVSVGSAKTKWLFGTWNA